MTRPRLFCELPAGLAAVSLRLQGGAHCRPPISRMGNKAGYSKIILGVLGLHSGQGAGAYWWAEADQDVAALLRIYPDPVALLEVARIIRGWSGEEPRALWERLRAERKERGSVERIAQFAHLSGSNRLIPGSFAPDGRWVNSARDGGPTTKGGTSFGGDDFATSAEITSDSFSRLAGHDRAARLAEYAMIAASNRLICVSGDALMNTGQGGTTHGGEFATAPEAVAEGMERVAEFSFLHQGSFQCTGPEAGIGRPEGMVKGYGFRPAIQTLGEAFPRLSARGWPPVRVSPSIPTAAEVSAAIGTPGDLDGCIVYSDPPYINTTGYGHDLSRAAVVAMAQDFAAMGATVAISEQTPIAELDGWESVEISDGRVGAKRTFSAQKNEWLTMNRTPGFTIAKQSNLFGASE